MFDCLSCTQMGSNSHATNSSHESRVRALSPYQYRVVQSKVVVATEYWPTLSSPYSGDPQKFVLDDSAHRAGANGSHACKWAPIFT